MIPILDSRARRGVVGDVVNALEPETEAHPAALLGAALTMFGSAVGAGPHVRVGGDRHPARLHLLIIGKTARARKGTGSSLVREVFRVADPDWELRVVGGFGSGESLVDMVADEQPEGTKRDHRLFVREPEFARVLAVANREGSTLSAIMREAWDGGRLAVRSRGGGSTTATGAHICVLADCTGEEIRRNLTSTMTANGFANRYLYLLVERLHRLPSGGNVTDALLASLATPITEVLREARKIGTMHRSPAAELAWHEIYKSISDEDTGIFGAVTARAEAHLLRLAVTYALVDASPMIEVDHLRAAAGVWDYARQSALAIFGESTGSPAADRLYSALIKADDEGLSGEDQHKVFSGHLSARDLRAAAESLVARGLAVAVEQPTGGRPTYRLFIAKEAQEAREVRLLDLPSLSSLSSQGVGVAR